jgi:hypothetical protein
MILHKNADVLRGIDFLSFPISCITLELKFGENVRCVLPLMNKLERKLMA